MYRKFIGATLAILLAVATVSALPQQSLAKDGEKARALGAVLGLIIGGAIASKQRKEGYHSYGYGQPTYGNYFSPTPGITCYADRRACYQGSYYSDYWTHRVYGY